MSVVAAPRGGLGNQLFNVVAALSVAELHGWDVDVDLRNAAHAGPDRVHSLEMLLPFRYKRVHVQLRPPATVINSTAEDARMRLALGFPRLRRLTRSFAAANLGNEPDLFNIAPGTRVSGYFQTYAYAKSLDRDGLRSALSLKSPSLMWQNLENELTDETPIALHVRRGDYAHDDNFGILGPNYYFEAVRHLQRILGRVPIWVFTDDPSGAGRDLPFAARIIGPELTGAEAMNLMSRAAGLAIANSSLSWWSAWLSLPNTPIVAPSPWFAGVPVDINDLLPQGWTRLAASFMQPLVERQTQENS